MVKQNEILLPNFAWQIVIEQTYSKKVEALFSPNLWRERTQKLWNISLGGGGLIQMSIVNPMLPGRITE